MSATVYVVPGALAVILFVRGNWCPFCNAQVKELTQYYREIRNTLRT